MVPLSQRSPPALQTVLAILDPTEDGQGVVIADDLLARHPEIDRIQLSECRKFLDLLLADETTPNSDLKGMLNRLTGRSWHVQFELGADANAARRYLEALQAALLRKLG